ncbi:hypothetical protein AB6A40_001322 [Gnathostoma spinigerum]|uniref:Serine/threonine-protein phosphatase PGAM5, mitochondrial n=1 Tax=Gnathostoma spinigerum TaxID=75299 RepID=A0ABD6E428_9BILA
MTGFSKLVKFGVPTTAALLSGGYWYEKKVRSNLQTDVTPALNAESNSLFFSPTFADAFPYTKWNSNWDMRDPYFLIDRAKYEVASESEKKEMLEKAKPKATRNIILIRHGQYNLDSSKHELTPLGREQALKVGERLSNSGIVFSRLVMSTMTRAMETATLILDKLPELPSSSDSILEEGAPYPPEPPVGHWKPKHNFYAQGSRIEAAFRKYIHRASPKQKEDSFEIIVCHANVIRYFVCRALQFPPEGWLRMSLGNCSITWLVVRPSGKVTIRTLGDIGHLPKEMVSFS